MGTRGSPKTIIERSLSGVNFALDHRLQKQKKKANERILPFVTDYHPVVGNRKRILMDNGVQKKIMLKTVYLKPAIISHKRGKSVKDALVR